MSDELFIEMYDDQSRRHAVLDGNGLTAWLYVHAPSEDPELTGPAEKACFVYNRAMPIDVSTVLSYRPSPPPIAVGYAAESAVCVNPGCHDWRIVWSVDSRAVVLTRDREPWCLMLLEEAMHGYSKSIRADGPWGSPWDQMKFESIKWKSSLGGAGDQSQLRR